MKTKTYLVIAGCALLLAGCASSPAPLEPVNIKASIPPEFNFSKRGFKVISSFINKKKGTMSTLYGNDIALRSAKVGAQHHAAGLEMAMVTWQQKPNPYWFGNNIPGLLLSVEMISSDKNTGAITYALFEGQKLILNTHTPSQEGRISYIMNRKPSVMP